MGKTIKVDPVSRIEGHLAIKLDVEEGKIVDAHCCGEMFRGFEQILKGRDPLDAQQIVQRICGVCPISHGTASIFAQDEAYRARVPENGRLLRNLILGANYIQSHIIHFYQLSALDFVDITALAAYQGADPVLRGLRSWLESQIASRTLYPAAPFLPRYEGDYIADSELNATAIKHYVEALEMRRMAHEAAAIFSGKMPHAAALVPGGVTERSDAMKLAAYVSRIQRLLVFIENAYLPDVKEVASAFPQYWTIGRGPANFLSFGAFPETSDHGSHLLPRGTLVSGERASLDVSAITESTAAAFFSSPSGLRPAEGETIADPSKHGAYSWLKAPRYNGSVMEVGPLARMLVAYHSPGHEKTRAMIDKYLRLLNKTESDLNSVAGRHLVRALECKIVADRCLEWAAAVNPNDPAFIDFDICDGSGVGLMEAPRGALGHWLRVKGKKIDNYQCIVPSTWNCSPRDERGVRGPVEQALISTPIANEQHPIEAARVVRAFDPCLACAIH